MKISNMKIISLLLVILISISILPINALALESSIEKDLNIATRNNFKNVKFGPYKGMDNNKHAYNPFKEKEEEKKKLDELKRSDNYCKDSVLIKLKNSYSSQSVSDNILNENIISLEKISKNKKFSTQSFDDKKLSSWYKGKLKEGSNVIEVIKSLSENPNVIEVEPDYVANVSNIGIPNENTDPNFNDEWYLEKAGVKQAWQYLESQGLPAGGSSDVVVAVIDTGVDYNHPDLIGNMWINSAEFNGLPNVDDDNNGYIDDIYGVSTVSDDRFHSGNPMDDHGHGTHVAGIIAATSNNDIGGVGVAYNVKIMAIKAGQSSGVFTYSDIAEAIDYARMMGADIINMSFGGYSRSIMVEDALQDAFTNAVLIAAAGNDALPNLPHPYGKDMFPAATPWVLGVMAERPTPAINGDNIAPFSNWDYIKEDSHEYHILAPGVDIFSTLPNNNYAKWDGTSMAAPVVSGIAALLRTKFNDKNMYSSRFIMGQLASTGNIVQGKTYAPNKPPIKYYEVNAYNALTKVPTPKLSYLEHYIFDTKEVSKDNDTDGIVDAGETIDLGIVIRNHWGKGDNVEVKIDTISSGGVEDPYVTLLNDTVNYGSVGTFNTDDNGFIIENDQIVGVENPFTIKLDNDTPNDHVVKLNITITANNGFDSEDKIIYNFEDSISFIVRNGQELPNVIIEDMTLTKDKYWIVPNATLIDEGATVTVEPGTQIQFWSSQPEDPYGEKPMAYIEVRGNFIVNGTAEEPVEMFASGLYPGYEVKIFSKEMLRYDGYEGLLGEYQGYAEINYAKIMNPNIAVNKIDHSYFSQDNFEYVYKRYLDKGDVKTVNWYGPVIYAEEISNSIFYKLGSYTDYISRKLILRGKSIGNLFDSCSYYMDEQNAENNVYLKNYKLFESQYRDRSYWSSRAKEFGYRVNKEDSFISIFPVRYNDNGSTYVTVYPNLENLSAEEKMKLIQKYANYLGGYIVTINDENENKFLTSYINNYLRNKTLFENTYPDLINYYHNDSFFIGLSDLEEEGSFKWINGEEITYTNWANNQPDNKYYDSKPANVVRLEYDGEWNDWMYDNYSNYPFIIEIPGKVYVTDIILDTNKLTLGAGGSVATLKATILPEKAENKNIIWSSSNPEIATVDNGIVTPLTVGKTVITATTEDGGLSSTCEVTVIEIVPETGVVLDKDNVLLPINEEIILNATIIPKESTNKELKWTSSNETIAVVDEFGKVKAISEGTTEITVETVEGYTDTTIVTVVVPVTEIDLEENLMAIGLNNGSINLLASILPLNATVKDVIWQSSNENILTVDENGTITPVGVGSAIITATTVDGGYSDSVTISVWDEVTEFNIKSFSVAGDYSNSHTLAVNSDGSVWSWGSNNYGQLGDNSYENKDIANKLDNITGIKKVSAGSNFSIALKEDGTVWSWGSNWNGCLGNGSGSSSNKPVQVLDLTNIVDVSAGYRHSLALKEDGTVWSWGYNGNGQLGDGTKNDRNKPIQVNNLKDIVKISAGYQHSVALDVNGNVWTWGYNSNGQIGDGTSLSSTTPKKVEGLSRIVDVSAGFSHTIALNEYGDVFIFGHDGTKQYLTPTLNKNISNVVKIEAGNNYSMVIKEDKTLWTWGYNNFGQLGDGTTDNKYQPIKIMDNVLDIKAGYSHSMAVKIDGTIRTWGNNDYGQLGDLTKETKLVPVQVLFGLIPDKEKPYIVSTTPLNNSVDIEVDTNIEITFNEGIKPGDTFGYIRLKDNDNNIISFESKTIDNNKLILKPIDLLKEGVSYILELPSNSIKDMFNNNFDINYTLNFTTTNNISSQSFYSQGLTEDGRIILTQEDIDNKRVEFINSGKLTTVKNNAILNDWLDPNVEHWMRFTSDDNDEYKRFLANNYWGTTDEYLIEKALVHFNDFQSMSEIIYKPILTEAPETTYPFVTDIYVVNSCGEVTNEVGVEEIEVHVKFNRDMDININPLVTFGPDMPVTDFSVNGNWIDERHWVGRTNITPLTGDGYQYFRVIGAVAKDDPWLVTGNDSERFRFEILTAGSEAMNLQAVGGEGNVTLTWTQDDFDLLAGFNIYRSDSRDGIYTKINNSIIPSGTNEHVDTDVIPGKVYFYKFTVVKTDLTESDFSNVDGAAPFDTIPPTINHEPITEANSGMPVQIHADITDNVRVDSVKLFYRNIGDTEYKFKEMVKSSDSSKYSVTLEGSKIVSPGFEYYIEANDGFKTTKAGTSYAPYKVIVNAGPIITSISPNEGPETGGTKVIIIGSNFKEGASITFDGVVASEVVVISDTRIEAITPKHFPATVDVAVENLDGIKGYLYKGFTYTKDGVEVTIPDVNANVDNFITVPVNIYGMSGLLAADLTLTYDSDVLEVMEVEKGNITSNFVITTNTNDLGKINISLASSTQVTGDGSLVYITFKVLENEKTSSFINIETITLNTEGSVNVTLDNGLFTVSDTYMVSGNIYYYNNNKLVNVAKLILDGNKKYETNTGNGSYSFESVESGEYNLTVIKDDEISGITSYDASLILQHSAGLITLNSYELIAADVNNDGQVTAMDASYVLKKAVGLIELPFLGSNRIWAFEPKEKLINVTNNLINQNLTAILIGDVSGDWSGNEETSTLSSQSINDIPKLSILSKRTEPNGTVTMPIFYDVGNTKLYSTDMIINYDTNIIKNIRIEKTFKTNDFAIEVNKIDEGKIIIGIASSEGISNNGMLLNIKYDVIDVAGTKSAITFEKALINENDEIDLYNGEIIIAIKGDVDANNKIDRNDLNSAIDSYRHKDNLKDMNGDGVVDIFDLVIIGKRIKM